MRTTHALSLALIALTACSNLLGIEQLTAVDDGGAGSDSATPGGDGPPTPAQILVTGQIQRADPAAGVQLVVELHTLDEQLVTSASVEGATGMFTLTVDTGGVPVSCYLQVVDPTGQTANTRFYFARPLVADITTGFNVFTQNELALLAQQGASSFDPATAAMLILVSGGNGPVANAVVDLMGPGDLRYAREGDGVPDPQLTATTNVGIAWAFRALPGTRSVTAQIPQSPGVQLTGPAVNLRPGSLTILTIQP